MKIHISNPNTKSETKNYIQQVLQVYILCTCHEMTQVAPPPPCSVLSPYNDHLQLKVLLQLECDQTSCKSCNDTIHYI